MASLFNYVRQIDDIIAMATDEDGVIDESVMEQLDALELEKNEKIDNCIAFFKSRKAMANALKEEKKAIERRQKTAENEMERMKDYLAYCLKGETHESTAGKISYRKTESVEITDVDKLPADLLRYRDPEPNKTEIKNVLKKGTEVSGAQLVAGFSVIIK